MKLKQLLISISSLAVFVTSAIAQNLIEISAVSDKATPESRELPFTRNNASGKLFILSPAILTTADIAEASLGTDPQYVDLKLTPDGAKKLSAATADMKGKQIAFIVEGKIIIAPVINQAPLSGSLSFYGFKEDTEAKALVEKFNAVRPTESK